MSTTTVGGVEVDTTELDRQKAVIDSGRSATVQEFYDWLTEVKGYRICSLEGSGYSDGTGYERQDWTPIATQPLALMAEFFGIDLNKIEVERRALLDAIREAHGD